MAVNIPTSDLNTPSAWAASILVSIGAPVNEQNLSNVVAWEQREGGGFGNIAANNPLNTSLTAPGASDVPNTSGVKAYTSPQQGFAATLATLTQYPTIIAGLKKGNLSVQEFADTVGATSWGTPSTGWPSPPLVPIPPLGESQLEKWGLSKRENAIAQIVASAGLIIGGAGLAGSSLEGGAAAGAGATAAEAGTAGAAAGAEGAGIGTLADVLAGGGIVAFLAWVAANWLRVLEFLAGAGLIALSLHLFLRAGVRPEAS
jgi:hypothetical protein